MTAYMGDSPTTVANFDFFNKYIVYPFIIKTFAFFSLNFLLQEDVTCSAEKHCIACT